MARIYVADKETLDKVYDIVSMGGVYGFIEHNAILAPGQRIEYIGLNKNYTPLTVTMGGGYSLGDWADFPLIKGNRPAMVRNTGILDYYLNPDDYTKKEDGTASDVANTSYVGGAFSWMPKIYKKEYMAGSDRYCLFSMTRKTEDFLPVGFYDSDNKELEGVWIPMFYGSILDGKATCISGTQPMASNTTAQEKTAIDAFGSRAKFFGGAIVETIIDLLIMFAKTTDLQAAYGNGNMSGYVNDSSQYYGVLQNAVVGGGQFYGTSDGKSLNKIFHSIVLGTYQQWMRDPYTICVNGALKVSKNYSYDLTGAAYDDTGLQYASTGAWRYPHRYKSVVGFGAVPDVSPYNGSTALGGCDGLYVNAGITAVALRFGSCGAGLIDGPRALSLHNVAGFADWALGAALLLLPPVGATA